jgi:hypothetical protein
MEPRKSIRDVASSNKISDIVAEQPIVKIVRKVEKPVEEVAVPQAVTSSGVIRTGKIRNLLSRIKPVYLIGLLIIIVLTVVLVFIPANTSNDPVEQAKIEAEIVKKQLSRHMILPENEQIDIRKITNKMEDPFFQNAEVGDYLVIFYKNRIAYIYSVEKDIIVNAGVVFIDPKTATTTSNSKSQ